MLLIVWHSRTGASRALAQAAWEGAQSEGSARLLACEAAQAEDVLGADGLLFACPENLGSMSGEMKAFFDRTYYPLLGRIEGRPYGSLIAAGSDGQGAQRQLDRIATGWRLRRVVKPVVINMRAQTPEEILAPKNVPPEILAECRELGQGFAAALSLGVF